MADVPVGHPDFGKAIPCSECTDYLGNSGLNRLEQAYTVESIRGDQENARVLRFLATKMVEDPFGMLWLYGAPGTAKTLVAQIVVAELARRGVRARFYHAKDMEQAWFDDLDKGTENWRLFVEVPVLAIDELDQLNWSSAWVAGRARHLINERYRRAGEGQQVTVGTLQYDPFGTTTKLPEELTSRFRDGQFNRVWDPKFGPVPSMALERHGEQVIPPLIKTDQTDARPYMRRQIVDETPFDAIRRSFAEEAFQP